MPTTDSTTLRITNSSSTGTISSNGADDNVSTVATDQGLVRDTIDGGADNDTLIGGMGDNVITTRAGDNTIVQITGGGSDIITDFDIIDTDMDGSLLTRSMSALCKIQTAAPSRLLMSRSWMTDPAMPNSSFLREKRFFYKGLAPLR